MPRFVEIAVPIALAFAVASWRDDGVDVALGAQIEQGVDIIRFVGDQPATLHFTDERRRLCAIGGDAIGEPQADGQAVAIDSDMKLACQPAFRAGKVLIPPLAPLACG